MLYFLLFSIAIDLLLFSSCRNSEEQLVSSRLIPIKEANGYVVPQDSIDEPVFIEIDESEMHKVTLQSPRKLTPLANSDQTSSVEAVPFFGTPVIRVSGKGSYLLPLKQEITTTTIAAGMPEVAEAKEMYSKDENSGNFSIFSKRQGLKHNVIWSILEDHQGNLWFCLGDGFTKFDGKFFYDYPLPTGPISRFPQIFQDIEGNIWFGTTDSLVKFDGRSFTKFSFTHITGALEKLMVDQSGIIWLAPKSGGISLILPSNSNPQEKDSVYYTMIHFGSREGFTDERVKQIMEDKSGNLWFILFNSNVIKLEDNASSENYTFHHLDWRGPQLVKALEDRKGRLWLSSVGCVFVYDGSSVLRISESILKGEITAQLEDSDGNLWFSTEGNGLLRYATSSQSNAGSFTKFTINEGLSSSGILCMLEDKNGMLWIGTEDGVNRYNGQMLSHITFKDGLAHPKAMSILQDKYRSFWFGSYGQGVSLYDGNTFRYLNTRNGLMGDYVWSIVEDHAGDIWLGTLDKTVFRYSISEENQVATITHFYNKDVLDGNINIIYEDHADNLWWGGTKDDNKSILYKYTHQKGEQKGTLASFALTEGLRKAHMILNILEDNDHNIWFGTFTTGLTRYTPPTADQPASFLQFSEKEGLSNNRVWSSLKDHRGNLWFGTDGNGLVYYNGKSFVDITTEEGLSNNHVLSCRSDHDGNLWIGTQLGLNMLPKNIVDTIADKVLAGTLRESDIVIRTYMYEDGFLGLGCHLNSICEDHEGNIWVGTNDRVTICHPEGDVRDTIPPNIQLTGIELFNEAIDWVSMNHQQDSSFVLENGVKVANVKFNSLGQWYNVPHKLSLAHDNNYITFKFIGITMNRPGRVKYQYMLDGFDNHWSAVISDNHATYGNLPPGNYTFKVRAKNSEKYWSDELSYRFTIRRPWWSTWWACAVYALMVSVTAYGIYNFFKKRLLLRQQLKAKHDEAIRLKDLDTFKSQLFTNLTHEFRTPLTVILGMAKQLSGGTWNSIVASNEKARIAQGLKMIENNGKNLLQLINQLLDLSKLENKSFKLQNIQADIIPYLRYVTESFQSYAEDIGLTIRFFTEIDSLPMDFDPEQTKQVLTNLISNALKFTPSGGEIIVSANISEGQLSLIVTDTGIGISEKDLPYVLDRFYQADSSTTRVAQGTGIGLAHTQELLKIMGGSISLKSELGKGTSIAVLLPIRNEASVEEEEIILPIKPHLSNIKPYAEMISDDTTSQDQHASSNEAVPQLLIIEDNRDVVEYLKSCLEDQYRISVAYNGKAGVEIALEAIPDFIISDVMMPEMDGFQVCDTLKNDERTSHIPIILLTAKADAASRLAGLRRGADAYMAKPFNPEELHIHISMLLENRRRMAAYYSKFLQSGTSPFTEDLILPETIQFEDAFMKKVNATIEDHYTDEYFSLPELCHHLGMSRSQLFRKMKAVADIAPSDLIRTYRLNKAKTLLEKEDLSVAEVTYKVGFKDPSYFSKLFQEEFGVQPSALKNKE